VTTPARFVITLALGLVVIIVVVDVVGDIVVVGSIAAPSFARRRIVVDGRLRRHFDRYRKSQSQLDRKEEDKEQFENENKRIYVLSSIQNAMLCRERNQKMVDQRNRSFHLHQSFLQSRSATKKKSRTKKNQQDKRKTENIMYACKTIILANAQYNSATFTT
jgi:uncharacterized protein YbcC (UPF0753/DUF2309 family)